MATLWRANGEQVCDVRHLVFHGPIGPEGAEFRASVPADKGLALAVGSAFILQTDNGRRYPATVLRMRSGSATVAEIRGRVGEALEQRL